MDSICSNGNVIACSYRRNNEFKRSIAVEVFVGIGKYCTLEIRLVGLANIEHPPRKNLAYVRKIIIVRCCRPTVVGCAFVMSKHIIKNCLLASIRVSWFRVALFDSGRLRRNESPVSPHSSKRCCRRKSQDHDNDKNQLGHFASTARTDGLDLATKITCPARPRGLKGPMVKTRPGRRGFFGRFLSSKERSLGRRRCRLLRFRPARWAELCII